MRRNLAAIVELVSGAHKAEVYRALPQWLFGQFLFDHAVGTPGDAWLMSTAKNRLDTVIEAARTSILCLGSGDGSQQKSILNQGHPRLTATFFDSKEEVLKKWPETAPANLEYLERNCRNVFYEIDATRLDEHVSAIGKHDIVSFYFPHTGVPNNRPRENLVSHKTLLKGFLRGVPHVLERGGSVEIAMKLGLPYDNWDLPALIAESTELELISVSDINDANFPGYVHRLTKGALGPMKSVEHRGAKVYGLGRLGQVPARTEPEVDLSSLGAKVEMVITVVDVALSHEDLCYCVVEILKDEKSRLMSVLDIRREYFDKQLDTRALNKALYAMQDAGKIEQCKPAKGTNKPRWKIAIALLGVGSMAAAIEVSNLT